MLIYYYILKRVDSFRNIEKLPASNHGISSFQQLLSSTT